MMGRPSIDGVRHTARLGILVVVAVLSTVGCSRSADTVESRTSTQPSPSLGTAAMRLDKPERLLGRWNESVDRRLIGLAEKNMGFFKGFVRGEPTSAVGTAYVAAKEHYSPELGVYRDDDRFILLSGVSGTVTAPDAVLDAVFAGLTAVDDVEPVPSGPLGGKARCGVGRSKDLRIDVCVWASAQSLGMIHFGGLTGADDPGEKFRQIRSQTEHSAG
ncbi:hypothetical protein ABUL04_10340 [Micromonospora harpali]|uniref:Lipoprotein n=2 Tax=Micromonosporaceae TaxID=28056 RepID=A0A0D0WVD0_9ACTN|nr:hypothetical protein [Micromonospora haikouensis]KIR61365.1 hypothetical protein TK50_27260 [Micromonospora haikouensis]